MDAPPMIRPATLSDHDWCARLMASSEPWITLRQDLATCLEKVRRPGTELFIAESSVASEPLGFVLLHPYGFAGSPYINSIAVAASARAHGVGAALLRAAERHYVGRKYIFLLASSFNLRAQQFYHREGYQLIAELKDYVVPGYSELILCKSLL